MDSKYMVVFTNGTKVTAMNSDSFRKRGCKH